MKNFYPSIPWMCCWLLLLPLFSAAQTTKSSKSSPDLAREAAALAEPLDKLYRELHAAPELSYQEEKTAARLAGQLRALGFEVTEKIGGHGIVGILRNGPGPVLMLRADMDALPLAEKTGLPYASTAKGLDDKGAEVPVMHACGHDMHMTVWTGTAMMLSRLRAHWKGTLVMVGQPAEERGNGAEKMLLEGLFSRFPKPDYALALHVNANMPVGTVGVCPGPALASVDMVDITVFGTGGHGAYPHTTVDPIVLAARMILDFQTIVSRETPPIEPSVVTVGSIHGGTKHNIIPDEVHLQLTLRSYSDQVRQHTLAALERISKGIARSAGLPEDRLPIIRVNDESIPATINDPALTARVADAFRKVLPADQVQTVSPVMGGEDFGLYARTVEKVPACIYWLGAVDPAVFQSGKPLPSLHSPFFAPLPAPTIRTGVLSMTAAALDLLR